MVAMTTTGLKDFANSLTAEGHFDCRLMLRKSDHSWKLQAMMADSPGSLSSRFCYDYGHVAFVGGSLKGVRLASWLLRGKAAFRRFQFVIPTLQTQINSQRFPGHIQRNTSLGGPEPFSLHTIQIVDRVNWQVDDSPLVKEGSPSFRNTATAARELIYGDKASIDLSEPEQIRVQIVHKDAMIESVHLHPTSASIMVQGKGVSGVRLEVRGSDFYHDRRLRKAGLQRFSFRNGVPDRLWIMLSKKDRWLDYRDFDLRGNRPGIDNDLIIDPTDCAAQIAGFIFRGESETIECKQEISNDGFLRTVAAFANGSGGVLLFGVVNQTGEVKGLSGDVQKEKDKIAKMIHDVLVPQPRFRLQNCKLRGKDVIALFVEQGDSPPYGVYPANPKFCVRRGATTQPATQAEVSALAQRNVRNANSLWF